MQGLMAKSFIKIILNSNRTRVVSFGFIFPLFLSCGRKERDAKNGNDSNQPL